MDFASRKTGIYGEPGFKARHKNSFFFEGDPKFWGPPIFEGPQNFTDPFFIIFKTPNFFFLEFFDIFKNKKQYKRGNSSVSFYCPWVVTPGQNKLDTFFYVFSSKYVLFKT